MSRTGAARALLVAAERSEITVVVCEQVIAETEHALARKNPEDLPTYRDLLLSSGLGIFPDPSEADVQPHRGIIRHDADLPILVAAMQARVDFLVTLNQRHFIDDPQVAERSGLRIGTPGDALAWVRDELWGASVQ